MRNLVVCCDGTWNTAEQRHDGVPVPTNVIRLYNALADANEGVAQLKYYHPGVGTEPGFWDRVLGGATGGGLDRNIMSAYHWLCRQYVAQDRIYLFGFSRGAYTARSLAGFMSLVGLLDVSDLSPKDTWARIERAFQRGYRERRETRADWKNAKWAFHTLDDGSEEIPVEMVGVWDTVGALGIPNDLGILNLLDATDEHMFHDTSLGRLTLHARHAVALDEIRASFQPTLWTNPHDRDLKQVWFPGVHCDVGGGYRETGLSDIALKWMIDEAKALDLGFRKEMVRQIRPDARDVLHDSWTDVFRLLPNMPRSVPRLDPTGKTPPADVHRSVTDRRKTPPISHAPYRTTVALGRKGASHQMTVYAIRPWNDSGLYLEAGKTYRFAAEGEWLDREIACGPEGTNDGKFQPAEVAHVIGSAVTSLQSVFRKLTGNEEAAFKLAKRHDQLQGRRVPWFCLVGAIANGGGADANGNPGPHESFVIGTGCDYTPAESGYFHAYANDAWNFYENNRGSVSLTITRL